MAYIYTVTPSLWHIVMPGYSPLWHIAMLCYGPWWYIVTLLAAVVRRAMSRCSATTPRGHFEAQLQFSRCSAMYGLLCRTAMVGYRRRLCHIYLVMPGYGPFCPSRY